MTGLSSGSRETASGPALRSRFRRAENPHSHPSPASMSPRFTFVVPPESKGTRVETFLSRQFRNHSPHRLARATAAGRVTVHDEVAWPGRRVWAGAEVAVTLSDTPDVGYTAEPIPLDVAFEDPWLLIVNKPPGMIAHPTRGVAGGTLINAAQHHLDRSAGRGVLRPGVVHRLDAMTSGILALAKTADAHAGLSGQFEHRTVRKTYLALVAGDLRGGGEIALPVGRRPGTPLVTCAPDAVGPKPARTRWRTRARLGDVTLVECEPRTGRNHQIRIHFAALGHPVLGDGLYVAGGGLLPKPDRDTDSRHALHAAGLSVVHPITGCPLTFGCAPRDFDGILRAWRENPR